MDQCFRLDTFNLTVTNTNDAPTVANPIADKTTAEDASFQFIHPHFADVDSGDFQLSYYLSEWHCASFMAFL